MMQTEVDGAAEEQDTCFDEGIANGSVTIATRTHHLSISSFDLEEAMCQH